QSSADLNAQRATGGKSIGWGVNWRAQMEDGMTIAKVPDWMELKPAMMPHLIREHEKLGRTLTEEETVRLLRSLGFEISQTK
ncbi:MAG TPA: hypothetical protein VFP47_13835, partial [Pyrinomonadaceae bacterium]|nr:hypothetical protein [Pyrinomonadaceae bacterium]